VEANGGKVIRVPIYKGRSTSSILRKSKKISDTQKA
jgi:bifunctional ADP-heptose synthase (sugar kinase/adenylyltransferase)